MTGVQTCALPIYPQQEFDRPLYIFAVELQISPLMGKDAEGVVEGCAISTGKGKVQVVARRFGFHLLPVGPVPQNCGHEFFIKGREMPRGGKVHRCGRGLRFGNYAAST